MEENTNVWERAEEFDPERFDLEGPVPNETNTDFRFIPFSGGPRKCVGDQFALLEATVALAIFLQNFSFELIPDQNISMTTGATIHTTNKTCSSLIFYVLMQDPSSLKKAHEEVDRVLGGRSPTYEDMKNLKYLTRCITESLRLYPHLPVLIRRALVAAVLPGNYKVNAGQDIMISVYNVHHSSEVKSKTSFLSIEMFSSCLFTCCRFIPFSGGPRKCVGDQFALLEATVALAISLHHQDFGLLFVQNISMTTGATIHTTNGLYMKVKQRQKESVLAAAL
ncbi:carotene epsilon-monooxygenase, chloroplastic-like [Lycium ferocissimum]|uniref:carotene epsilon-monooxygenase, chloroplastic-like n=1 Tax=Lycium ferocissimum TaxID=112874 RepID=UPI0028164EC9|nr:carotene epsilon-monooxygenase, chloroplastic-like [Lycium ferocissimum]